MNAHVFPFDGPYAQACIGVLLQGMWDCTGIYSSEGHNEVDLGFPQTLKER